MAAFIGQPAGSATALSTPRSARLSPKPGRGPYQFRKIQVCPKDLPAALRQAEPALDRAHVVRARVERIRRRLATRTMPTRTTPHNTME